MKAFGNDGLCHVEIEDGHTVEALAVAVDQVGARTTLSLRPERVEINPDEGATPNRLEGRIEELIYLGDHIRTRMSVAGHDDFIVKVPNTHGHKIIKEGETAAVGWASQDCRALDPMPL